MQSFSLNINANFNNDPFCDELIKSLSDDEDDYEQKEPILYDDDNDVQISHFKKDCILVDDNDNDNEEEQEREEQEQEEEEEEVEDSEDDECELCDNVECDEEDEIIIDYDPNIVLDKDKKIAIMLNKYGYKDVKQLCYTDQGSVWRAKSQKLGYQSVIIKIASKLHYKHDKDSIHSEDENILSEIELLQNINKELNEYNCNEIKNCVINVIDTFETIDYYLVVLEDGGIDLFKFVNDCHKQISNGNIMINEWQNTIKIIASKLIKLLNFLHTKMSVCHLDISLENVLISNIKWIQYLDATNNEYKKKLSPDFSLKLIDFGAAQCFADCDVLSFNTKSVIGKPIYCSPQIYKLQNKLTDKYFDARKTDIWSFGVSLFIMAIGCPPWQIPDHRNNKLFQTIVIEQNMEFVLRAWNRLNYIDDGMKDLLKKIFVCDEENRISANDITQHYWINN